MDKYVPLLAIGAAIIAIVGAIYEGIQLRRLRRRKAQLWEGREDGR